MFRRASSVFMPSEAEKAARAHEKKKAAEKAEFEKQLKLERRRSRIVVAANAAVPRAHQAEPESPVTPTGETPFKGMKRYNPLEENKLYEKIEEEKLLQQVSDERGINLSQAKVLIAQNPKIAQEMQRPGHSRSPSSFSGHQSSEPSTPTTPTTRANRDAIVSQREKARVQVLNLAAPMLLSEVPKRHQLSRYESSDSIDAKLLSPHSARFSDIILEDSMRSLGIELEDEATSPTHSHFGADSHYTASMYSPASVQSVETFPEHLRTPRAVERKVRYVEADSELRSAERAKLST